MTTRSRGPAATRAGDVIEDQLDEDVSDALTRIAEAARRGEGLFTAPQGRIEALAVYARAVAEASPDNRMPAAPEGWLVKLTLPVFFEVAVVHDDIPRDTAATCFAQAMGEIEEMSPRLRLAVETALAMGARYIEFDIDADPIEPPATAHARIALYRAALTAALGSAAQSVAPAEPD